MERMTPDGLKQTPTKKVNHIPQKVEAAKMQPINADINLLDVIMLGFRSAVKNKVFEQYQISTGKVIAVSGGLTVGIGSFANINWALLLTGSVVEIFKLIVAVVSFLVALLCKK